MSVSVTKSPSVLVRPSSETVSISHHSTINLSPSDKDLNVPVTALLMFEHPIHEVANTIRRALSQALVHYYPIAGRRVAGADAGEAHIHCNGEGVAFVSASANCALKEAMSLDRSNGGATTLLDELAIFGHTNGFGPTDPPLLMQVTEFSCGGFVLGVTWNHAVADGAGMGQFLQAVGELARGLPAPSVAPVRWDESLQMPAPEVSKALQQALTSGDTFDDLAWVDFTIPSRVITRIKAEFGGRFAGGEPCSKFEAASAVMWQCRTRVTMRNPEAPALFSFVANLRQHVGAKKGYYGNCLAMQFVTATSGMVANGDVVDLVKMIKDTKGKIADKFRKNDGRNDPEPEQAVGETTQEVAQLRYDIMFVSSWGNLGFDEADFGSGRPARVTPYPEEKPTFPACTMCLRWKGKDGVNVLSAMLREEHVEAFRQELARFT